MLIFVSIKHSKFTKNLHIVYNIFYLTANEKAAKLSSLKSNSSFLLFYLYLQANWKGRSKIFASIHCENQSLKITESTEIRLEKRQIKLIMLMLTNGICNVQFCQTGLPAYMGLYKVRVQDNMY